MLLAFKHTHLSSLSEIIGEHFFGCVFVIVFLWVVCVNSPCASSLNNVWYLCPRCKLWQTHTQELQHLSLSDEVHISWKSYIFPQSLNRCLRSLLPPLYIPSVPVCWSPSSYSSSTPLPPITGNISDNTICPIRASLSVLTKLPYLPTMADVPTCTRTAPPMTCPACSATSSILPLVRIRLCHLICLQLYPLS